MTTNTITGYASEGYGQAVHTLNSCQLHHFLYVSAVFTARQALPHLVLNKQHSSVVQYSTTELCCIFTELSDSQYLQVNKWPKCLWSKKYWRCICQIEEDPFKKIKDTTTSKSILVMWAILQVWKLFKNFLFARGVVLLLKLVCQSLCIGQSIYTGQSSYLKQSVCLPICLSSYSICRCVSVTIHA